MYRLVAGASGKRRVPCYRSCLKLFITHLTRAFLLTLYLILPPDMPKRKSVLVRRRSKLPCRVIGCNKYGKPMLALASHLRKAHGMSLQENNRLPVCSLQSLKQWLEQQHRDGTISELRQPGLCQLCGNEEIFMRLDRHLMHVHGLRVHQYEMRVSMQKAMERHRRLRDCVHRPYPCRHTVADFCPAQVETLTDLSVDDDGISRDVAGDPTFPYPKVGLFRVAQIAEETLRFTTGANSTIKKVDAIGETHIFWHLKKLYITKDHEMAFDQSIKPPTTTSTKGGKEMPMFRYVCQLCHHWHQIKTWATPVIKPKEQLFKK